MVRLKENYELYYFGEVRGGGRSGDRMVKKIVLIFSTELTKVFCHGIE